MQLYAKSINIKKLHEAYDSIRLTDSTILRFIREKITEEYHITPENWRYFELALILVSLSTMLQLHRFTNMLLALILFMVGEQTLMCCCGISLLIVQSLILLFPQ